jgi:hypothetical protein
MNVPSTLGTLTHVAFVCLGPHIRVTGLDAELLALQVKHASEHFTAWQEKREIVPRLGAHFLCFFLKSIGNRCAFLCGSAVSYIG